MLQPHGIGNLVLSIFRGNDIETESPVTVALFGKARAGSRDDRIKLGAHVAIPIPNRPVEHSATHAMFSYQRSAPPIDGLERGQRTVSIWHEDDTVRAWATTHALLRKEIQHSAVNWPVHVFNAIAHGVRTKDIDAQRRLSIIESALLVIIGGTHGELKLFTSNDPVVSAFSTAFPGDQSATWRILRDERAINECTLSAGLFP